MLKFVGLQNLKLSFSILKRNCRNCIIGLSRCQQDSLIMNPDAFYKAIGYMLPQIVVGERSLILLVDQVLTDVEKTYGILGREVSA